jgi:hypothetical protein
MVATMEEVHRVIVTIGKRLQELEKRRVSGMSLSYHAMATTACTAYLFEGPGGGERALIVNVGDSEGYHYQAKTGKLMRLTREHDSFLGGGEHHEKLPPDVFEVSLAPGDRLYLMSDGIKKYLTVRDLAVNVVLARWQKQSLPARVIAPEAVIEAFQVHGAPVNMDDKSMVEVACRPDDPALRMQEAALTFAGQKLFRERLASASATTVSANIVERWRSIPRQRLVTHWKLLALLYPLKSDSHPQLNLVARYADLGPESLMRAFMLLESFISPSHEPLFSEQAPFDEVGNIVQTARGYLDTG